MGRPQRMLRTMPLPNPLQKELLSGELHTRLGRAGFPKVPKPTTPTRFSVSAFSGELSRALCLSDSLRTLRHVLNSYVHKCRWENFLERTCPSHLRHTAGRRMYKRFGMHDALLLHARIASHSWSWSGLIILLDSSWKRNPCNLGCHCSHPFKSDFCVGDVAFQDALIPPEWDDFRLRLLVARLVIPLPRSEARTSCSSLQEWQGRSRWNFSEPVTSQPKREISLPIDLRSDQASLLARAGKVQALPGRSGAQVQFRGGKLLLAQGPGTSST